MSTRHALHLAGRLARSVWPLPPRRAEVAWVESVLTPAELGIWLSQPRADRRESIGVARRAQRALVGTVHECEPVWLAAALLHDVGKRDARLGTLLRTLATLAGALGGPGVARIWSQGRGLRRRVASYLLHAEIGADAIEISGGRPEVAEWAGAHHRPEAWDSLVGVPGDVAHVLAAADGESTEQVAGHGARPVDG